MATETDNGAQISPDAGFSPPYTSFKTLMNTVERMAGDGALPSRIDRSYLSNLPGGSQTILLSGMKSLGLIDDEAKPTTTLKDLVQDAENRPLIVQDMVKERYAKPLALGTNATQAQLEEAFRQYGVTGSTLRKAVAFFLAAAKYADLELSPHFRTPRQGSNQASNGRKRQPRRSGAGGGQKLDETPPPKSNLPTLVQGLVERLPKDGEEWDATSAKQWLSLARLTFPYVYGFDPSPDDQKGGE